jgi:RNA polymerase sigma-32 factor
MGSTAQVEQWLPLIRSLSLRWRVGRFRFADRYQEAVLAVCEELPKFDPERGAFAGWVRDTVRYRFLKVVRGPDRGLSGAPPLLLRDRQKIQMGLHTAETLSESVRAYRWAISPRTAFAVIAYYAHETESLEALDEEEEWEPEAEPIDLDRDILRAQVQAALAPFYEDRRFADLLRMRLYPPEGEEPATLEAVGATWGVSKERVRQVECVLLSKLRKVFSAAGPMADDATGDKE